MIDEVSWVDKHGRRKLFPPSDRTIDRLTKRPTDPFPAGTLIGGKRYWQVADILAWVARQGDTNEPSEPESSVNEARDALPRQTYAAPATAPDIRRTRYR